jgi:hypothetical protein
MKNNDLTGYETATLVKDVFEGIKALLPYVKCEKMKERVVNLMLGQRENLTDYSNHHGYTPKIDAVEISLWYALIAIHGFLTYNSPEFLSRLKFSKHALNQTLERKISSTPLTK